MNNYILGSHNAWSYLTPKHWWMRPFSFMARCQRADIKTQYEQYGVRCFDLRIRTDQHAYPHVYHGFMEYDITPQQLMAGLSYLNIKGDCYLRVIHEVRTAKAYTTQAVLGFKEFCYYVTRNFKQTRFWCGRNLYNWEYDYEFESSVPDGFPIGEPTCEEKYSSVCPPKLIDDWWPWLYARLHNKENRQHGTDSDILLIDYVNIG